MTERLGPDALPLVSIGVAVFNGGEHLNSALESVASQDYPNIEILISDDGSTDGSFELCKAFAARHPHCQLVRNPQTLGVISNYNQLISLGRGKYFVFADQDDRREPSFVSRCVEVLEADPDVVLCHSHTGVVWPGMTGKLYHVNTFDSIDRETSVIKRYWSFLRRYSDTTIYGLIRMDSLRRTNGWQRGLGSSNRLLFELLLMGSFREVPEILYWYTGKGLRYRPGPAEDYERQFEGRRMPRYYLPFVALATAQLRAIVSSGRSLFEKFGLVGIVLAHVALVNGTKAIYRLLWRTMRGRVPRSFEKRCGELVHSTADVRFVIQPQDDPEFYLEGWPVRAR